jgi:hypothetical protein
MPREYMLMEREVHVKDNGERWTVPGSLRVRVFSVATTSLLAPDEGVRLELIYQFERALDQFERERERGII